MKPVYRLYIDETGDHTYGRKQSKPFVLRSNGEIVLETTLDHYPLLEKDDKRYLGLTGCIFRLDYYRESFVPNFDSFKRDFFDPDDNVVFHAKEIIQRKGPFHIFQNADNVDRFNAGLIDVISGAEYTVINVVIDKKNHIENYGASAWHPYHYCLASMLWRYCMFLMNRKARGDVMAESRGKTEDFELKRVYSEIYGKGTRVRSSKFYQEYLTSKEIKIKPKEKNVAGLQLSDILAHPLKKYTLLKNSILKEPDENQFWLKIIDACNEKIDCKARDKSIDGYGLVFIK